MEFLKELSFTHLSMPTEILTLLKKRISLYFYIMGNKKSLSTAIFKNFSFVSTRALRFRNYRQF